MLNPTYTHQAQLTLLYVLTGKDYGLSRLFPKQRGVTKIRPASIAANCPPPKRKKTRSHPPNPHMNISRERADCGSYNYRSHSHRITDKAMIHGCRIMSNVQKEPASPRQSPCHRKFTDADWQHANVGPQPFTS